MARKKKKQNRIPPLSTIDICLYVLGIALLIVAVGFGGYGLERAGFRIAFRDGLAIAADFRLGVLFTMPFLLWLVIGVIVVYSEKQPIFGNKKIKYGQAPWRSDLYPLFDERRKRAYIPPGEREYRRSMKRLFLIGLVLTLCLVPFAFFGRSCLTDAYELVRYNAVNTEVSRCHAADCSEMRLTARYVMTYRGGSNYWEYHVRLTAPDGSRARFSHQSFDSDRFDTVDALEELLALKHLLPGDKITVEGADKLDKVIQEQGLNEKEAALLYELFAE